jgi:hypothetical protein
MPWHLILQALSRSIRGEEEEEEEEINEAGSNKSIPAN